MDLLNSCMFKTPCVKLDTVRCWSTSITSPQNTGRSIHSLCSVKRRSEMSRVLHIRLVVLRYNKVGHNITCVYEGLQETTDLVGCRPK